MRETQVVEVPVEVTAVPEMGDGPVLNTDVSGEVELWHFWASPVRRNALRRVIALCQADSSLSVEVAAQRVAMALAACLLLPLAAFRPVAAETETPPAALTAVGEEVCEEDAAKAVHAAQPSTASSLACETSTRMPRRPGQQS